jgi:hypothetical protein
MRELLKEHLPTVDIRFFFMSNAWLTTAHKRTNMDWARTQGCEAAVGDPRCTPGTKAYGCGGIPESWIS